MSVSRFTSIACVCSGILLYSLPSYAGPFILSGTDADDHGSATATTNLNGWLFMQKVLENLAPAVTNGNKTVVSLGSNPGSEAGNAALSAFSKSSLPGMGWTFQTVNDAAPITAFLSGGATGAGIIMLDSASNVTGGLTGAELTAISGQATALNNYVGAGGGLFSQANGFGFLGALGLGVTVAGESATGIQLTPSGQAAFPGLTNGDLSSGPYHSVFNNVGLIPVLGTSTATSNIVIIGSNTGSIIDPGTPTGVPEPVTAALMGVGLLGLGLARRRRG